MVYFHSDKDMLPMETIVGKVYEIGEARARQIKLAKLKEILGELFHRVVIPPVEILEGELDLDYILPASFLRPIDDLSLGELDDLLKGDIKFFILK